MPMQQAQNLLNSAEMICTSSEVELAIQRLAAFITADYQHRFPLLLTVMTGGVFFAGQLLPKLNFPLHCDYIHASRYAGATQGGKLEWHAMPTEPVLNRDVVLLDDILDEGHTLLSIQQALLKQGAKSVACAVLTNKLTGKIKPIQAEYIGIDLPNRFVFGCGMDIHGLWRNLPAIYALPDVSHAL